MSSHPTASPNLQFVPDRSPFSKLTEAKFACPTAQSETDTNFDLKSALQKSLHSPHHFPALVESVFPGDQIAISLQPGLPESRLVLETIINQLIEAGIDSNDIVVVIERTLAAELGISKSEIEAAIDSEQNEPPIAHRIAIVEHEISVYIHNPENDSSLSYLMANKEGEPVHVNRLLVDADMMIPVGIANADADRFPIDAVYPQYCSAAVQQRLAEDAQSQKERRERQGEIREASEILGSFFVIQLVAGPGGNVSGVFSGSRGEVYEMAQAYNHGMWAVDVDRDAEIVVATIESKTGTASWDDFVVAVLNASQVSRTEAPIIVWCDLESKPSSHIRAACLAQFEDHVTKKMTARMKHFAAVMQDRPIYLHSQLKRGRTETLGIGCVETIDDILKIAQPFEHRLLLRDAHRCQLKSLSN